MSELSRLKKENKQLKALLGNAVELLNRYKELMEHPEKLAGDAKKARRKGKKSKPDA
jgi:hypothetical protein